MSVKAIKNKDWNTIASIYNGSGYLALAKKLGREPYNITMAKNYDLKQKTANALQSWENVRKS